MNIRAKVYLSLVVPVLAILFYSLTGTISNFSTVNNMKTVLAIVETSSSISRVVHEMQKERGMTAGYIGSKGAQFASEIKDQRKNTDFRLDELKSFLSSSLTDLPVEMKSELNEAIRQLDDLNSVRSQVDSFNITLGKALAYYTGVNGKMLSVVSHSANYIKSVKIVKGLTSYANFLLSKERAGIERAVLTNTFAMDKFSPGYFEKFIRLVAEQDSYMEAFTHHADSELMEIYNEAKSSPAFAEVEGLRKIASAKAFEGRFGIDAKVWFNTITKKINVLKDEDDKIASYITESALELKKEARNSMFVNVALSIISVVTVIIMLFILQYSVLGNISKLVKLTGELNSGDADLTRRINVHGRDEIAKLAENINTFIGSIQAIVEEIKSSSSSLASSSSEFASASEELRINFDNQTGQVSDMASAMEEMNVTSATINDHINDVKSVTDEASESTQKGSTQLEEVVGRINNIKNSTNELSEIIGRLNVSSGEIENIVGAISDIADQTNLLALNAAIEAARAGDAGRGFAVVADEVRKLAEKTQDATKQIVDIINTLLADAKSAGTSMEHAAKNVLEGVTVVEETGHIFANIEDAVSKVKSANDFVTVSISEQADAINVSTQNTTEFSQGIQNSADAVMQINTNVNDLEQQIASLNSLMGRFKT